MSSVLTLDPNKPFGTIVVCADCKTKLGELHFCAPHGIVRFFACPKCGAQNDFVNSAEGLLRLRPRRNRGEDGQAKE